MAPLLLAHRQSDPMIRISGQTLPVRVHKTVCITYTQYTHAIVERVVRCVAKRALTTAAGAHKASHEPPIVTCTHYDCASSGHGT